MNFLWARKRHHFLIQIYSLWQLDYSASAELMTSSVVTLRHCDVISHVAFEERDYGFCSGWKFGEKSSRFIESEKFLKFLEKSRKKTLEHYQEKHSIQLFN